MGHWGRGYKKDFMEGWMVECQWHGVGKKNSGVRMYKWRVDGESAEEEQGMNTNYYY